MTSRLRRVPRPLLALLAVAALLSVAWSLVVAPMNGPDESAHVAYVQHLAETGHGPTFGSQGDEQSSEGHLAQRWGDLFSTVGALTVRPGWTRAEQQAFARDEHAIGKKERDDAGSNNPVAQNPPLYYLYSAVTYRVFASGTLFTRMAFMRLANIPLLLGTVLFSWLLAGELFGRRRWPQVVAAGVVAVEPQLGFLSGVVNPDNLLAVASAGFAWTAVGLVRRGPALGWSLGAGATAAAVLLSHPRGLYVLAPALLAFALAAFVRRDIGGGAGAGARRHERTRNLAAGLAVMVVGGLLALRWSQQHGGVSAVGGEVARAGGLNVRQFVSYVWQFYLPRLGGMEPKIGPDYGWRQVYIEGFFGSFGSLEVLYPPRIYDALQVAAGAGLLALWTTVTHRFAVLRAHWRSLLVLVTMLVATLAILHVSAYRDLVALPTEPLIQGRYLLPLVALFGCAVAFVVDALPRRAGAVAGALVVSAGTLLSLGGLGLTLVRFYA